MSYQVGYTHCVYLPTSYLPYILSSNPARSLPVGLLSLSTSMTSLWLEAIGRFLVIILLYSPSRFKHHWFFPSSPSRLLWHSVLSFTCPPPSGLHSLLCCLVFWLCFKCLCVLWLCFKCLWGSLKSQLPPHSTLWPHWSQRYHIFIIHPQAKESQICISNLDVSLGPSDYSHPAPY